MCGSNTIWSAKDVADATNGKVTGGWSASGISIDSRTVKKGDIFVALEGANNDGHDYVGQALKSGAVAAIVRIAPEDVAQDKLVIVEDTQKALEDLGRAARVRTSAKVIGITGSLGKTGTKSLLAAALKPQGQTHASIKSYNNMWGVPLSLANMHAGTDYGVFEMGMNHANEITPLSRQVQPDIAIITTIAPVHIEHFENGLEGIADAKSEIFNGMQKGGKVILNADNAWFDYLSNKAIEKGLDVFGFGESETAHSKLLSCIEAANGTRAKADILGEEIEFSLQIAGKHIALNTLAVLTAVKLAGGDLAKAVKAIAHEQPVDGRGLRYNLNYGDVKNPVTLIDESYNASPEAMRAAFRVLALIDPGRGGRRIAVLGDMLELGQKSPEMHADLALPLKAANVDLVYTCGKNMKKLHDALPANQRGVHKDTSAELAQIVPEVLVPGDVVMVKGSLGSKMGSVVEALRAFPTTLKGFSGQVITPS
jgi:UDP-N-acetylmuramoyl-tripeptide--D-alanyl-D-alanine ligase